MTRMLALLAVVSAAAGQVTAAAAAAIALDVGHYHARPGAISARGVAEFEYNRVLARDIAAALAGRGHDVILIGEAGDVADLHQRAPQAAGRDLLISIHHDSVQPEYLSEWRHEDVVRRYSDLQAGYSLFVSRRNAQLAASRLCASHFGLALRRAGFIPSRYHADPVVGEARDYADAENGVHHYDNLVVLRTAAVPALLFEAGVIVNRHEELRMRDPAVRGRIAASAVAAVENCLPPAVAGG